MEPEQAAAPDDHREIVQVWAMCGGIWESVEQGHAGAGADLELATALNRHT